MYAQQKLHRHCANKLSKNSRVEAARSILTMFWYNSLSNKHACNLPGAQEVTLTFGDRPKTAFTACICPVEAQPTSVGPVAAATPRLSACCPCGWAVRSTPPTFRVLTWLLSASATQQVDSSHALTLRRLFNFNLISIFKPSIQLQLGLVMYRWGPQNCIFQWWYRRYEYFPATQCLFC